jgi:hypothetical protein
MSRSSTGKNQQSSQLAANQAAQASDRSSEAGAITGYNAAVAGESPSIQQAQGDVNAIAPAINQEQSDVNAIAATPGYTPDEIAKMKSSDAGKMHATYGNEIEALKRDAANQGGNSAGLYDRVAQAAQARGIATTGAANDVEARAADANLAGRRLVPGMQRGVVADTGSMAGAQGNITGQLAGQATQQFAPVNTYQSDINSLTGADTSSINSRMGIENQPTFWQQAALGAINNASKAAASWGGKPGG